MRRAALRALSPIRQPLLWVDPGTPLTQEATAIAPFAAPLATVGELLVTNSVCLPSVCDLFGGAEGIRTPDLCDANAALFQLSYSPSCRWVLPAGAVLTSRRCFDDGGARPGWLHHAASVEDGTRRGALEPGVLGGLARGLAAAAWRDQQRCAPVSAGGRRWWRGRCGAWRRSRRRVRRPWRHRPACRRRRPGPGSGWRAGRGVRPGTTRRPRATGGSCPSGRTARSSARRSCPGGKGPPA